jgi:hypothetical protein
VGNMVKVVARGPVFVASRRWMRGANPSARARGGRNESRGRDERVREGGRAFETRARGSICRSDSDSTRARGEGARQARSRMGDGRKGR